MGVSVCMLFKRSMESIIITLHRITSLDRRITGLVAGVFTGLDGTSSSREDASFRVSVWRCRKYAHRIRSASSFFTIQVIW